MPVALISAGASLLGGYMQGESAKSAANTRAAAEERAARLAAEEARFRPVGVTTRFGSSQFTTGPDGRVSGAGYTLSPEMKAIQDRFLGLTGQGLTRAEGAREEFAPLGAAGKNLFELGSQYLAQSPEQAAAKYMAGQQNLLAPSRERQLAQLNTNLFNTGRGGLSVGATGTRPGGGAGLGATTPEMEAYYNSIAEQDAKIAAGAEQAGMDRVRFGAGLFGTGGNLITQGYGGETAALNPYEAYLENMKTLEGLGQQPLDIGINIGSKGSATSANALLQGGTNAAGSRFAADAYNPFANALIQGSQNPALMNLFGSGRSSGFNDYINTGNSSNLSPYYQNRLYGSSWEA